MKRSVFSILISLWLVMIVMVIALTDSFSLTGKDVFGINWESSEGEVSIGGGTAIPPTGDIPEAPPGVGDVGGGSEGSGGAVTSSDSFSIDPIFLVVRMKKGLPRQEKIIITNNRNSSLAINISQENLTNLAFTPEISFILAPNEEKEIIINLYALESEERDVVIGRINFQSGNLIKYTDLVLNLRERAPLFDIKTTLLKKIIFQGQTIIADVKILNLGDLNNIDVNLESFLVDSENNTYDAKKEMFAINDSFTGKVSLKMPYDAPIGKYFFTSIVSYKNINASSYESFEVIERVINIGVTIFTIMTLIIIVAIILIGIALRSKVAKIKISAEQISRVVPWGDDSNLVK